MDNKALAIGGATLLVGGGITAIALARANKRRKKNNQRKSKSKNKSKSSRSRSNYRKTSRKQRKPYTAGKRKDTSHRRIRYTKNNQPYIILKSGKARFISKKSVRNSRKRTGGRY